MRRPIVGFFLLALAAAASASNPTSARAVHAHAVASLGHAAAQWDILDVRHRYRSHRGVTFGFYGPGFSFYAGPRYYHP